MYFTGCTTQTVVRLLWVKGLLGDVGKVPVTVGEIGSFHKYDKIMILKFVQLGLI